MRAKRGANRSLRGSAIKTREGVTAASCGRSSAARKARSIMNVSWHKWPLLVLSVAVAIGCAADDDDGGDDGASASTSGDPGGAPASTDPTASPEGGDDARQRCVSSCDALANASACASGGFDEAQCLAACSTTTCATCLGGSTQCGDDCVTACVGSGVDPTDGADDEDGEDPPRRPNCRGDGECGLGWSCVACELSDAEGWCAPRVTCSSDANCRAREICAWLVEGGGWACLAADYCG